MSDHNSTLFLSLFNYELFEKTRQNETLKKSTQVDCTTLVNVNKDLKMKIRSSEKSSIKWSNHLEQVEAQTDVIVKR